MLGELVGRGAVPQRYGGARQTAKDVGPLVVLQVIEPLLLREAPATPLPHLRMRNEPPSCADETKLANGRRLSRWGCSEQENW